jgi:hypothetical protein
MLGKILFGLSAITIFHASIFPAGAQAPKDAQINAVRLTIAETVLATNTQLSDHVGSPIKEMSWSADLNDRSWSLKMKGFAGKGQVEIGMTGFLWGGETDDWIVTYSGGGQIAGEPIQINGKLDWPFDKATSDRLRTNFKQVAKFGEHSVWAWVVGTEVIVGATIGGIGGIAVSAAAPPLTIAIGLAGAIGTAGAAVTVSNAVRTAIESDKPTSPPAPPPAPNPGKEERLTPKDGMLYAAVSKEGQVLGSGPDAVYRLIGTFKGNEMFGRVTYQ